MIGQFVFFKSGDFRCRFYMFFINFIVSAAAVRRRIVPIIINIVVPGHAIDIVGKAHLISGNPVNAPFIRSGTACSVPVPVNNQFFFTFVYSIQRLIPQRFQAILISQHNGKPHTS